MLSLRLAWGEIVDMLTSTKGVIGEGERVKCSVGKGDSERAGGELELELVCEEIEGR